MLCNASDFGRRKERCALRADRSARHLGQVRITHCILCEDLWVRYEWKLLCFECYRSFLEQPEKFCGLFNAVEFREDARWGHDSNSRWLCWSDNHGNELSWVFLDSRLLRCAPLFESSWPNPKKISYSIQRKPTTSTLLKTSDRKLSQSHWVMSADFLSLEMELGF